MSGYDFFSGFLGSLGQQMQQKKQQKLAIEEEDRQFQRAMSREEALAKSRERVAIAAEERQRSRAEPKPIQKMVDGRPMAGLGKWNPEKNDYDVYGELAPVAPTVLETRNVNGRVKRFMSDGTEIDLGESDAGMRTRGANERAKAALASRPAESAPPKDSLAGEIRRVTRGAVRDFTSGDEVKKLGILEAYGLDKTATREQLMKAVENEIRGIKPEVPEPVGNPELEKKYAQVLASKIAEQKGETPKTPDPEQTQPYTEFADDIASARKRYAGGDDATEDEIIEALIYEGKLRRNSDGRLSKN